MNQKIIRSVRLYNDHNGSDKVINMRLIEVAGGFVMNYENGPNGGTMTPRTKTPTPVTLAEAEKEWDKLYKAKVKPNEYRIDGADVEDSSYTAPMQTKTSSGKANMMSGEVKDDSHRNELLNSSNYVVQEKFDGVFLKVIVKDGGVLGSNKKGLLINVPECLKSELSSSGKIFESDAEHVGFHLYMFELPSCDGMSAKSRYDQRHSLLCNLGVENTHIHIVSSSGTTRESKLAKIKEIKDRGGEGVIFKALDAEYVSGISPVIFKDKFKASATVCVISHNTGIESVMIGAFDSNGVMKTLNALSTPRGKPPVGSIIEVEYLYANPKTDALQQGVFKSYRPEQDLADCKTSKFKYKTPLNHGLFSTTDDVGSEHVDRKKFIHGNWTHIFHESGPDISLRFVFDTDAEEISFMQIQKSLGWENASITEIADVQDSLLIANEEALLCPSDWCLDESNDLPNWAIEPKTQSRFRP